MAWVDTTFVIAVCTLIILLIWSAVMHQSMLDTVKEIRDIVSEIGK